MSAKNFLSRAYNYGIRLAVVRAYDIISVISPVTPSFLSQNEILRENCRILIRVETVNVVSFSEIWANISPKISERYTFFYIDKKKKKVVPFLKRV